MFLLSIGGDVERAILVILEKLGVVEITVAVWRL